MRAHNTRSLGEKMRRISVRITLESEDEALIKAVCRALSPEASQRLSERGEASLSCSGSRLEVGIKASDPGAARALINSYLYWIAGITSSIGEVSGDDRANTT